MGEPSTETASPRGAKQTRTCTQRVFERYARLCAHRPRSVCAGGVLLALACCPGFLLLKFRQSDDIYFLRNAYGTTAAERNAALFDFNPTATGDQLFFVAKDGKNIFTERPLRDIGKILDAVSTIETPRGERLADVCENSWRGWCEGESVFHQFNDSAVSMGLTLSAQPGMGEVEGLAAQLFWFCEWQPSGCQAFLAPQEKFTIVTTPNPDGSGLPIGASLMVEMYLDNKKDGFERWMNAVLKEVHGPTYSAGEDNFQTDDFYVINWSKAARDLEASRPALKEWHLMLMTFLLINLFTWSAITSPTCPRSRGLLASSCMLVVVLSLACSAGLSGYVGVPLTPMTALVVFTLFGVSVDDIIVIVHAHDRVRGTPTLEGFEERLAESVQESGPAITLTSLTSLVAFFSAAICPIPVITWFCVTAAFGILTVYLLQLMIFLPIFVLDERRRLRRRRDCCFSVCCGPLPAPACADDDATSSKAGELSATSGLKAVVQVLTAPSVGGGCGVVDRFARLLTASKSVQVVMTATFLCAVGLSCWGASKAQSDVDLSSYYIDTSFAHEYFDVERELWSSPTPFFFVIEHKGEGMVDVQRQSELDAVFRDITLLSFIEEPYENWLWDFEAYLGIQSNGSLQAARAPLEGDPVAFGARVAEFLDTPPFAGPSGNVITPWRHKRNVVLENGVVKYSRLTTTYDSDLTTPSIYIEHFYAIMKVMFPNGFDEDLSNPRVPNTWGVGYLFQPAQRDDKIKFIIFYNLGIACGAVALTVMVMLSPLVGFFVGVLVVALDAVILALLTLEGAKLDIVAFLCLSMNIGLVVDYSTHTAYTYLNHPGSPDEKLHTSVTTIGASVLSGGGSTLLGVCVLAFASSKAFRTFFYVLGTAIAIGTLVGISVSPVMMRIFHGIGRCCCRCACCRCCCRRSPDADSEEARYAQSKSKSSSSSSAVSVGPTHGESDPRSRRKTAPSTESDCKPDASAPVEPVLTV